MPAPALPTVVAIRLPGRYAAKAGFEHHLVKPVSTDVLLAAMNEIRRGPCAPQWIRTTGLRLRRPTLYPAELVAHAAFSTRGPAT